MAISRRRLLNSGSLVGLGLLGTPYMFGCSYLYRSQNDALVEQAKNAIEEAKVVKLILISKVISTERVTSEDLIEIESENNKIDYYLRSVLCSIPQNLLPELIDPNFEALVDFIQLQGLSPVSICENSTDSRPSLDIRMQLQNAQLFPEFNVMLCGADISAIALAAIGFPVSVTFLLQDSGVRTALEAMVTDFSTGFSALVQRLTSQEFLVILATGVGGSLLEPFLFRLINDFVPFLGGLTPLLRAALATVVSWNSIQVDCLQG